MNELSENEIIKILNDYIKSPYKCDNCKYCSGQRNTQKAIEGILDLYKKQKEENIDAILDCMEQVNQELMDDLLYGKPHRKPARDKIKRLEEELKKEKKKNKKQAEHIQNINKRNENQRMQLKLLQEKNKELQKENYPMFFERGISDKLEELLEE